MWQLEIIFIKSAWQELCRTLCLACLCTATHRTKLENFNLHSYLETNNYILHSANHKRDINISCDLSYKLP